MATVNVNVSLDNGTSFNGSTTMADNETLVGIARDLADLIRANTAPDTTN